MIDEETRIRELEAEVKRLEGCLIAIKQDLGELASRFTPFLERLLRLDEVSDEVVRTHKTAIELNHVSIADDITTYCEKYGEHPE